MLREGAVSICKIAAGAGRVAAKAALLRRDPLERLFRQLVEEAALDVVARLPVQHARLRMAQVQALARAGDGHIGQAAFFLQAAPASRGRAKGVCGLPCVAGAAPWPAA